jgi:hypothetical protein
MKQSDPAQRLSLLGEGARAELFTLLSGPVEARAEAIGRLHSVPKTRPLAEVLIDLEVESVLRLEVLRCLRDSLKPDGS